MPEEVFGVCSATVVRSKLDSLPTKSKDVEGSVPLAGVALGFRGRAGNRAAQIPAPELAGRHALRTDPGLHRASVIPTVPRSALRTLILPGFFC